MFLKFIWSVADGWLPSYAFRQALNLLATHHIIVCADRFLQALGQIVYILYISGTINAPLLNRYLLENEQF